MGRKQYQRMGHETHNVTLKQPGKKKAIGVRFGDRISGGGGGACFFFRDGGSIRKGGHVSSFERGIGMGGPLASRGEDGMATQPLPGTQILALLRAPSWEKGGGELGENRGCFARSARCANIPSIVDTKHQHQGRPRAKQQRDSTSLACIEYQHSKCRPGAFQSTALANPRPLFSRGCCRTVRARCGTFLMFLEILPGEAAHRKPLWQVFPNACGRSPEAFDDTWCFFVFCKGGGGVVTSWWVFAVAWVIVVICCCCLRMVSQQILISSPMLPKGGSVQGLLIWNSLQCNAAASWIGSAKRAKSPRDAV